LSTIKDGTDLRARIDRYLDASGLARRGPKIVPLTGDASDRRYFRVLLNDGESVVLALHAGPIDFASLPFANVAELLHTVPLPVPRILGHSDDAGVIALEDLGEAPSWPPTATCRTASPSTSRSSRGSWTSSRSISSKGIGARRWPSLNARRCRPNGRRSRPNWRQKPACCAIGIITAGT